MDEGDQVGIKRRRSGDVNALARELFDGLPARYDLLAEVLSFGQNQRWRRAMVDGLLSLDPAPARILDVATGTAGVALMLTDRSDAMVAGVDITEQMLRRGHELVARHGKASRIRLVAGRAEQLPFPDQTFDALTFTYLLRYVADPAATLRELSRVVRPGGAVASLEFLVPGQPGVAPRLGGVHPPAASGRRAGDRRAGMGRGGPVPRSLDQRALPALPTHVDGRRLALGRH